MIDEEATKERYGYYSIELSPQSQKRILARCDMCGIMRETTKNGYHKLCKSCARKGNTNCCGRQISIETRKKISEANKGKHPTKEAREKMSASQRGRQHTKETKEKMSAAQKGKNHPMFGKHHTEKAREKMRQIYKSKRIKRICLECGKEFEVAPSRAKGNKGTFCSKSCASKARIRNIRHKHKPKKTKPELIFEEICKRNNLPFHYVGDGSLWIGKKGGKQLNPDFIEANGKKVLVEIMGAYWHSPLLNKNLVKSNLQLFRKNHYKRYRWHSIFLWDTDLEREDAEVFVLKLLERG